MSEEMIDVVNEQGQTIATLPRNKVHGNPELLHKVAHVLVFNDKGQLLLQKRSLNKDVAPGKWDTSVGGHVPAGEDVLTAALREMHEELGVMPQKLTFLYSYIHSNNYESELVYTYKTICSSGFDFNREEIDEIRFWSIDEIKSAIGSGLLSDNFEGEFLKYLQFCSKA